MLEARENQGQLVVTQRAGSAAISAGQGATLLPYARDGRADLTRVPLC